MRCFVVALAVLLLATPALAWNKPTHQITGAIAYDLLQKEHGGVAAIAVELLRQHPEYPEDQRDRWLLSMAARWPDDIRNNRKYHKGDWHYVNYPVQFVKLKLRPPQEPTGKLLTSLADNLKTLRGTGPAPDRAVALCWVMHQVGDLHQPMHVVALYGPSWPDGDRGGNSFFVRVREGRKPIDLHAMWDGLLGSARGWQTISNKATELRVAPEFSPKMLHELKDAAVADWVAESYGYAKHVAYGNGSVTGSADENDGAVLPDWYTDAGKLVAERRVVLAGYRLATTIAGAIR